MEAELTDLRATVKNRNSQYNSLLSEFSAIKRELDEEHRNKAPLIK